MSNIIPFAQGAKLPAYLANRQALASINADVASGHSFPILSIKGKVFTLVKDNQKKILTRPDDPDEVLQNINLTVIRANKNSRVFYAKAYSEDDSEGAKPTCYSLDGTAPAPGASEPQAKKCQLCPHAVWGSKPGDTGKGTACSVNTRLAIVDPDNVEDPWLLRVPAGSRKNFADACKVADSRGLPYNAVVFKVGFDKEAPSPKLTFKPVGLVSDAAYEKISGMYESDEIKEIVGLIDRRGGHDEQDAAPAVEADELDQALATKGNPAAKAKAKPAPVQADELDDVLDAAAPAPAPAPKAKAKPAPVPSEDDNVVEVPVKAAPAPAPAPKAEATKPAGGASMDDLLGDLDSLLGQTDD